MSPPPHSSISSASSTDTSTRPASRPEPTRKSLRRNVRMPRRYSSASSSTPSLSSTPTPSSSSSSSSPSPDINPLFPPSLDTAHLTAHHLVTADDLLVRIFDDPRNGLRVRTVGRQADHANHTHSGKDLADLRTSFRAAFKYNNPMRLQQTAQAFTRSIQDQGLISRDEDTALACVNLSLRYAHLKYHSPCVEFKHINIENKVQSRIVAKAVIPRGVLIRELDGLMSADSVEFNEVTGGAANHGTVHGKNGKPQRTGQHPRYNMFSVIRKTPGQCGPAHADRLLIGPARFINHACKPNCRLKPFRKTNAWGIETLMDIQDQEEITVSYGKAYFGPGECACASCQEVRKDTDKDAATTGTGTAIPPAVKIDSVIGKRTRTQTALEPCSYPTPPAEPAEPEDSARPRKRTRTRY